MAEQNEHRRLKGNLQDEVDGAAVYAALADAEKDPNLANIYRRLAAVERAHAEFWQKRLDRQTGGQTLLKPSFRARSLSWLARRFGPGIILPTMMATEARGTSQYNT